MTTLKDIARETGVSTTTVSVILNNKAPHISDATKELVLSTAEKLHYRPNIIARSLVKNRSQSIGFIMPDIANPFFAEIAKGIYEESIKKNYTVSIFNTDDDIHKNIEYIDYVQDICVDGMVVILSTNSRAEELNLCAEKLQDVSCPVVLIDRRVDGFDFISVETDNKQGAFLATEHLIKLGHKRIGCICSYLSNTFSKQRFFGYLEALQSYGVKFEVDLLYEGDFRTTTGYEGAKLLADKGVTAIFAFDDLIAYGVYQGLKEVGVEIPRDISVVGYDDLMFSSMLSTPLTTIRQPALEMGRKAVQTLFRVIEGKQLSPEERNTIFTPELIVRGSTRRNCC